MPFVSGYVDAPLQGISQAAPSLRLPTQATALIDCIIEPEKGFRKRPPMRYLGKIITGGLTSTARQAILNDPDDGSLVLLNIDNLSGVITPTLTKLSDLSHPAITVTTAAHTYLNTGSPAPQEDLKLLEALDTNFIVNRKVTTALSATNNATRPHEALVWCKQGGFGWKFNITVTKSGGSPITGSVTTPDGGTSGDAFFVATNSIMNVLLNGGGSTADGGGWSPSGGIGAGLTAAGFTWSLNNSVLYLSNATDFTIVSDDAQGGVAFIALKGSTNDFSNLPKSGAPDGIVFKIAPTNETNTSGAYYVQYDLADGVWKECLGPGANDGIDTTKLPVALVKSGGAWTLDVVSWKNRQVGDATTSPDPGLVGYTVNDMCYLDGRLGLLYDEGCLFCAADDPFRLYPATVATEIDSDPFEVLNPDNERALWKWAEPMYGGVVFVGKRSQTFIQNADVGSFTAKSVQKKVVARFKLDSEIQTGDYVDASILEPIVSNDRIYLATPRANAYFAFFEFAADRISGRILPDDISAHVPTLLPNTLDRVVSVDPQFALLYGASGGTTLYLGLFRYANYQRVQTAWFQWNIHAGFTLSGLAAHGTLYYVLLNDGAGNGYLCSVNLDPEFLDAAAGATVLTKLDVKVPSSACTVSYSSTTGNTTITPPVPVDATTLVSAAAGNGSSGFQEGYLAQIVSFSNVQIVVRGNWSGQNFYLGYAYTAQWIPSRIYRRSQDNRPITRARLTVKEAVLDVVDAVNLQVYTNTPLRPSRTLVKAAQQFGPPPTQYSGEWRIKLNARNDLVSWTIEDASHIGGKVAGFEWFGNQDPVAQRTT